MCVIIFNIYYSCNGNIFPIFNIMIQHYVVLKIIIPVEYLNNYLYSKATILYIYVRTINFQMLKVTRCNLLSLRLSESKKKKKQKNNTTT